MSLREQVESDLSFTLESIGDWGLPVELIDPDGLVYQLNGQILYDTIVTDPETGGEIIVHKPVVTLRRSSLTRVPLSGEKWAVKIPIEPSLTANKVTFLLERPTEEGGSIGFIRLYLMKAKQS